MSNQHDPSIVDLPWRLSRRQLLGVLGAGAITGSVAADGSEESEAITVLGTDARDHPTVDVDVHVDENGSKRPHIPPEAFQLTENGANVPIKEIDHASGPVDLVIVFDDTSSMYKEIGTARREAANLVGSIVAEGIDARFGLVTFKDDIEVDIPLTASPGTITNALENLRASAGGDAPEDNFDAIEAALSMDLRPEARTVIVDITDQISHYRGDGTGYSEYTIQEVAEDILRAGASYIVVSPGYGHPKAAKKVLAEMVGGLHIDMFDDDFETILDHIVKLVIDRYIITYETNAAPGETTTISVLIDDSSMETLVGTEEISIPYALEPAVPERYETLATQKRSLAGRIDANALGHLNETPQIESIITATRRRIEAGAIRGEQAVAGIEQLVAGERITDAVLAGAGPGHSPAIANDLNLSKRIAESSLNPLLELIFASVSLTRIARHTPFLRGVLHRAATAFGNLIADIAGLFSATVERMIRDQATKAGFTMLKEAEAKVKAKGKKALEEEFEDLRDDHVGILLEDVSSEIFEVFLFERDSERTQAHDEIDVALQTFNETIEEGLDTGTATPPDEEFVEGTLGRIENVHEVTGTAIKEVNYLRDKLGILTNISAGIAITSGISGAFGALGTLAGAFTFIFGVVESIGLPLMNWGIGVKGLIGTRRIHTDALPKIAASPGGGV